MGTKLCCSERALEWQQNKQHPCKGAEAAHRDSQSQLRNEHIGVYTNLSKDRGCRDAPLMCCSSLVRGV